MEKNCVLTQPFTDPAYLMPREPKLALWKKDLYFQIFVKGSQATEW